MPTVDFITALFYEVDEQLGAIPKNPEAHLWPRPSKNGHKGSLFLPRIWTLSRGSRSDLGPHALWWCMLICASLSWSARFHTFHLI